MRPTTIVCRNRLYYIGIALWLWLLSYYIFFSSNIRIMYTRLHEVAGISFLLPANEKTYTIIYSSINPEGLYFKPNAERCAAAELPVVFIFFTLPFVICIGCVHTTGKTLLIQLFATFYLFIFFKNHFLNYTLKTSSNLLWFWLRICFAIRSVKCACV